MIKAIIFDIGSVIVNQSPVLDEIVQEFNLDKDKIYNDYLEILRRHEVGEIDEKTFWKVLKEKLAITKPITNPSPLIRRYKREIKVNQDVWLIICLLKEKGYKLAALSNTLPAHINHLASLGVFEPFDVGVTSPNVHLLKPDPEIYKLTLSKLGTRSNETIFIDDAEEYLEEAKKLGINCILFRNSKQLNQDLEKLGVDIEEPSQVV